MIGSILAGVTWMLPLVGWIVPSWCLPFGLGSWILGWRGGETRLTNLRKS